MPDTSSLYVQYSPVATRPVLLVVEAVITNVREVVEVVPVPSFVQSESVSGPVRSHVPRKAAVAPPELLPLLEPLLDPLLEPLDDPLLEPLDEPLLDPLPEPPEPLTVPQLPAVLPRVPVHAPVAVMPSPTTLSVRFTTRQSPSSVIVPPV